MAEKTISEKILELAQAKKRTIAIGLVSSNPAIMRSLQRVSQFADIVIVGQPVTGFNNIVDTDRPGETLAKLLINKKVDGIVRGNLVAGEVMEVFAKELGYAQVSRVGIIRDLKNREFFIGPGGVVEGNTAKDRVELALRVVVLMNELGVTPKVGVLSIDETRNRSDGIDQSIDEAEFIVKNLKSRMIDAEWMGYAVEKAVDRANFIIPPNGVIGNFIWRSIVGFGGGYDLGDPGLIPEVFVDDSKYWDDFFQPILCAVALANLRNAS